MADERDPTALLPLKPEMLWILVSLHSGSRHGYGVMQDVEEQTGGSVRIQTGALYRFLHRLERDGLVEEAPSPSDESDARRRYYRITPFGHAVAAAELERMRAVVASSVDAGIVPAASGEA